MMPKVSPKNVKIDIMIIGAQKAGTTSLKHYLSEHPQLQTHPQKEFGYFWDDLEFQQGFEIAEKKYFFRYNPEKKVVAKNALLFSGKKGLQRLKEHSPNCRIVLVLRNPVERTYSAYQMEHNYGSLKSDFDEMEAVIKNPSAFPGDWRFEILVGMSNYAKQLKSLYEIFPREQITILLYDELKENPKQLCKKVFQDCGVDADFVPDVSKQYNVTREVQSHLYSRLMHKLFANKNPIKKVARLVIPGKADYKVGEALRNINKTKRRPAEMSPRMRAFLLAYFKPLNDELSKMIGIDLTNWNK